jgi:capsular exopolysaccharide synthesis family protein
MKYINQHPRPDTRAIPDFTEAEYVYASEPEAVHLNDYWKVLVKRRRIVWLVLLVAVAIGAYITFTATSMYTATATIKIEPQNPQVTGIEMYRGGGIEGGGGPYDYYQTQFKLLESRGLAAKVVSELNLESDKSFNSGPITSASPIARIQGWTFGNLQFVISLVESLFKPAPKNDQKPQPPAAKGGAASPETPTQMPNVSPYAVGRYMSFLTVKPVKNTRLVEIQFTTPDGNLSQTLANAHAAGFIRMILESRFELTKEARDFLDGKNTELKRKLERSEEALNRFRQAHGVVSLDKGENIVVERLVDLNRQLTGARAQRLDAESLYKTVAGKSTQYLSQVLTQGLIPTMRGNLLNLESEKLKLATIYKPDHPRIIELNQQISETRRSLNGEIANVVRGIEEAFVAARAREQALQDEAQRQQQEALNLKEIGVQYAVLEEEVKVNRTLYDSVLKRLNETNVSNDLALANIQISQRAERPLRPSSPDVPFSLLLFAALGLLLGVGLAYFLEYLDSTVATPEHVWKAVALNTFGVVPDLRSFKPRLLGPGQSLGRDSLQNSTLPVRSTSASSASVPELVIAHHPLSLITESYRTIRTALLFSQSEKPPQVMLLTSPSPSDGKTITTLNLAITLAQDGYNVLVIDGDLRKGCCHARMGLKNHRGLSNVLTGGLALDEAIQKTSIMGLSLLSRGVCPPNPSELLGSRIMREILTNIRDSFNFILIDSPPVIAVSDASVLSVISDGVLLVLNSRNSTTASARQAMTRLEAVRAPVLGVILNSIDLENPDYSYYRSYYGSSYADFEDVSSHRHNGDSEKSPKPEFISAKSWSAEAGFGCVPREFFDHMTAKLTDVVGPVASHIVDDAIGILGETTEAFPKSRLRELLDKVCREILDEHSRRHFENWMTNEIRSVS